MVNDARHFALLFRVELDDLIEDAKARIESTEKRFERGEISSYVRLENEALFRRELDAFTKFSGIVDGIEPSIYKCVAEIEDDFLSKSRDYVSRLEDPEAVFILLQRKLEKVRKFVSSDDSVVAS